MACGGILIVWQGERAWVLLSHRPEFESQLFHCYLFDLEHVSSALRSFSFFTNKVVGALQPFWRVTVSVREIMLMMQVDKCWPPSQICTDEMHSFFLGLLYALCCSPGIQQWSPSEALAEWSHSKMGYACLCLHCELLWGMHGPCFAKSTPSISPLPYAQPAAK